MRCLVVYYSLSGTTRRVAEEAARALAADIVEVRAERYAVGRFRVLRAAFDAWRASLPTIDAGGRPVDEYDFVMLLSPVWVGRAATPMRAYLAQNRGKLRRTAFLLTCRGQCPPRAFEEMTSLSGVKPEKTFVLREHEIKGKPELPGPLVSFLTSIRQREAA